MITAMHALGIFLVTRA